MDDTSHVDYDDDFDLVGASHLHGGWFGQEPNPPETERGSEPPSEPLFLPDDDEVMERDSSPVREVAKVSRKRLSPSEESPRPSKRRRVSKSPAPERSISKTETESPAGLYLGEVVIDNAYSLVSGKDVIKPGEKIWLYRDKHALDPMRMKSVSSTKPKDGKSNLKQLTLTGMSKKPVASTKAEKKKKADHIVYIINSGKRQIGRVPVDIGAWVSVLLDADMAWFTGTVIDTPPILRMGNTILISLRVYITPAAFTKPAFTNSVGGTPTIFNEGTESTDEVTLREKKTSLLRLFSVLSLRPRQGAPNPDIDQLQSLTEGVKEDPGVSKKVKGKGVTRVVKTELIGEGEDAEVVEVEGDEEEVLSENQLDVIYQKAQKHDLCIPELDPVPSFTFTLRPYQKQALKWMYSIETDSESARESKSIHPLWQEYSFPFEPAEDGTIDLCEDEKVFYFSPYSGELSLEFPRAEGASRGGILADVLWPISVYQLTQVCSCGLRNIEMGMGKTIMVSSLIHTARVNEEDEDDATKGHSGEPHQQQVTIDKTFRPVYKNKRRKRTPKTTLIVAPTSLISQWASELQRSSQKGSLKVIVWHGAGRLDLQGEVDAGVDVVVTSYGVLASEYGKQVNGKGYRSLIHQIEWLRIVCDEAHHIKSRLSKTSKAVYALHGQRKWALTGTPIVNRLEDLFSLLHFLDFKPWSDYSFFRSCITLPFLAKDPKAIDVVQVILESALLRRQKNMRDKDGKPIVQLPPKEVTVETLEFSPLERKIYNSVYHDARHKFQSLDEKGQIGKNWQSIFALLMRLRRAVLHPSLIARAGTENEGDDQASRDAEVDLQSLIAQFTSGETGAVDDVQANFATRVLDRLQVEDDEECPVCMEVMDPPVLAPKCMHKACKSCMLAYLHNCIEKKKPGTCVICGAGPFTDREIIEVVRKRKVKGSTKSGSSPEPNLSPKSECQDLKVIDVDGDEMEEDEEPWVGVSDKVPANLEPDRDDSPEVVLRKNTFQSSTKLDALVRDLRRLQDDDPKFRAVVFSQFTGFLNLIQTILDRERFQWLRLDGSMVEKRRTKALEEFAKPSRKPKVFLISLRAGGVGLNLTSANHVFMMDCWWNRATEDQAIDRCHRLGQDKPVYVKHYIIAHTIEKRIQRIQKRKTAIVNSALGGKGDSSESLENLRIMFEEDEEGE